MSRLFSLLKTMARVLLLLLILSLAVHPQPAQAGSGPTVDIPASAIIPVLDGVCGPGEYINNNAAQVSITVGAGQTFPVYILHTADDAYFCFGNTAGLPLPNGQVSQIAVYIDRNGDGSSNFSDDFGVWMNYNGSSWAALWGPGYYQGADPGGWAAAIAQLPGAPHGWQVEIRISRQTLGGWKHKVGMALFYHHWRWVGDDFSWPAGYNMWGSPQRWGNGRFTTGDIAIGSSASIPTVDGQCGAEYTDAATVFFDAGGNLVTGYLEHSEDDLFVCLQNITIPAPGLQNSPNAVLFLDRTGKGGEMPGINDFKFSVSYSGTVVTGSGDGSGYTGPGPAPGDYEVASYQYTGGWDAEFRVSGRTISRWWSRWIGLTVAVQNVNLAADNFGWPVGYLPASPNTWGAGYLLDLGSQLFLPAIMR